jgi:hypothetical protein
MFWKSTWLKTESVFLRLVLQFREHIEHHLRAQIGQRADSIGDIGVDADADHSPPALGQPALQVIVAGMIGLTAQEERNGGFFPDGCRRSALPPNRARPTSQPRCHGGARRAGILRPPAGGLGDLRGVGRIRRITDPYPHVHPEMAPVDPQETRVDRRLEEVDELVRLSRDGLEQALAHRGDLAAVEKICRCSSSFAVRSSRTSGVFVTIGGSSLTTTLEGGSDDERAAVLLLHFDGLAVLAAAAGHRR